MKHLIKIVNTESPDSPHYTAAQRIFRQLVVKERLNRLLVEVDDRTYPAPKPFKVEKKEWKVDFKSIAWSWMP